MSLSVDFRPDGNFKKFVKMYKNMDPVLGRAIKDGMTASVIDVEGRVKRSRKTPRKTGTLSRSITHRVTGAVFKILKGMVGTNLPYAAIHEYGGTFQRSKAWGRKTKPFTVTYKARRYLRDNLQAARPAIRRYFNEAIDRVFNPR